MDEKVKAWMVSLGFNLHEFENDEGITVCSWMKNGALQMSTEMATFFYTIHHAALTSFRDEVLAGIDRALAGIPLKEGEIVEVEFNTLEQAKESSIKIQDNGKLIALKEQRKAIQTISGKYGI